MNPVHAIARPLMAGVFIAGGIDTLLNPEPRAKMAGPVIDKLHDAAPALPDDRVMVVRANAAVQVGAAAMFAMGKMPRLMALILGGTLVPTTVGGHRFWEHDDPQQASAQRIHFLKNASMLGGLLFAATAKGSRRSRRKAKKSSLPTPIAQVTS